MRNLKVQELFNVPEELSSMTCKELRDIAKDIGIKGRWDMNKQELIDAINTSILTDDDITLETDCVIKGENENQSEGSQKVKTATDYLDGIKPGTLVAFKRNKNKELAMSGKFVSFENGKVIVESKQGTMFRLNPECIIWVKTGARWPKWVFSLFKKTEEVQSDDAVS